MEQRPRSEARDDPPPYINLFPSPPVYESVAGSSRHPGYDSPPLYPGNGPCPPGLEFLQPLDKVFIDEVFQSWHAIFGIRKSNQYKIVTERGDMLAMAQEQPDWVKYVTTDRGFTIRIVDKNGVEGIRIEMPVRFRNEIKVYNENQLLGGVVQTLLSSSSDFKVYDPNERTIYTISGPFLVWQTSCTFTIRKKGDRTEIGEIRKQWSNFFREFFTTADTFGVTFPPNLDVKHKALLLGAVILADYVHFQSTL